MTTSGDGWWPELCGRPLVCFIDDIVLLVRINLLMSSQSIIDYCHT